MPPWDFKAVGADQPRDSSAGACARCPGTFQKLFQITGNQRHLDTASRLLQALALTCRNSSNEGGLLLHSTAEPIGLLAFMMLRAAGAGRFCAARPG